MQLIALLNDADEGASFSLRPELICRFYNPGEAPVIDAERDFYAVGIPLFKSFENLRICVPEAVNRLVIVSDDADVTVICGKQVKKLRLQLSRVLKLVDQTFLVVSSRESTRYAIMTRSS